MADQVCGILSSWLQKRRIGVASPYLKGKILDYGCGVGTLAELCKVDSYCGVDVDEESIRIAHLKYPGLCFKKTITENEQFDTVVLLAVIEHIENPVTFLRQIKNMLKPKGLIVLTTPNPFFKRFYRIGSKLGIFSAKAEAEHKNLVNYRYMKSLVSSIGLYIYHFEYFIFGANQLFVLAHINNRVCKH